MRQLRLGIVAGLVVAALSLVAAVTDVPVAAAGQIEISTTPRISVDELKKLVDTGKVIVLDVRGQEAYAAGHIPGAILVPLETVAQRAGEWAQATLPVVTYCS